MSFSVGIVGLPNVGKSTLFKALTKIKVDIADYPFTTINPNIGVVAVPDEKLKKIAEVIKPEKVTPTIIEFVDIAGLVKGAHKGEGLGNQFLAQIRNCDAVVQVVDCFREKANPEDEIETIKIELEMKDLEVEERKLSSSTKLSRSESEGRKERKALFEPFAKARESKEKENLLSKKPIVYVYNIKGDVSRTFLDTSMTRTRIVLEINLKMEEEISELSPAERKELGLESQLDQLILACYNILELITFYTITGGKETRAWTLPKNSKAPQAGAKVHSDFAEFIRAEVIPWQKLITAGSWQKAREKGWLQTVGKDYIIQDGDVIEFKI